MKSEFFKEEIREGFTVSAEMKKVWAVEMKVLSFVISVCKKYDIPYFADYGTLLGTVRHKGFIPWDDDIDICLKRSDYMRLIEAFKKENNTDYVLTLVCIDGDTFLNMNFISLSCVRGQNPRNVIDTVVSKAEKPTQVNRVSPTISGQTLPRGKVYFGRPKDILTDVARGNNANVWINDGQVNITKITDTYTDEALILTPKNGLIGYPQQIQYGVSFRCLLNPKINVLSMVQLKNTEINGMQLQMNMPGKSQPQTLQLDEENMYQAYEVEHTGDTRGNDWYTTVNAYSRYGKDVVPAMMKGIGSNPNSI